MSTIFLFYIRILATSITILISTTIISSRSICLTKYRGQIIHTLLCCCVKQFSFYNNFRISVIQVSFALTNALCSLAHEKCTKVSVVHVSIDTVFRDCRTFVMTLRRRRKALLKWCLTLSLNFSTKQ